MAQRLGDAAQSGKLAEAHQAYQALTSRDPACEPKLVFCAGRRVALAHVDAAYDAFDKNDVNRATELLREGRSFGSPWQLLIGLGDAETVQAHTSHDPKAWSAASVSYQEAVLELGEPVLCPEEAATPDKAAVEVLYRKMAAALLLSNPVQFAHTKCSPCGLAFLTPVAGFTPRSQALPITFKEHSAEITPEGLDAAKALLGCVLARKATRVVVSAHTDDRGSDAVNRRLSEARLATVRKIFGDGGFTGAFEGQGLGKSDPFKPVESERFAPDELRRLNRRVELREITLDGAQTCR